MSWLEELKEQLIFCFIEDERWRYITDGLKITIEVTLGALVLGLVLGILIAIVRSSHDQIGKKGLNGAGGLMLRLLNTIAKVYLTVIRGTPTLVQLLLMYFVFLKDLDNKVIVAILSFGINSGAYVAEIVRAGIMSIDRGQMEAGRSLGLGYVTVMRRIILPQAFKNTLPALVNEVITLFKETSISGYIGLNELTRGGNIIQSTTFNALLPLMTAALIYLSIVMLITWLLDKAERKMRESDRR